MDLIFISTGPYGFCNNKLGLWLWFLVRPVVTVGDTLIGYGSRSSTHAYLSDQKSTIVTHVCIERLPVLTGGYGETITYRDNYGSLDRLFRIYFTHICFSPYQKSIFKFSIFHPGITPNFCTSPNLFFLASKWQLFAKNVWRLFSPSANKRKISAECQTKFKFSF